MVKFLLIILLLIQSYSCATNIELDDVIGRYIVSIQELKKMSSFGYSNMNQFTTAGMALDDLKKLCELEGYVICKFESKNILQKMGLVDANGKIYQFVKEAFREIIANNQL